MTDPTFEDAKAQREAILAEAARMYREDHMIRRICDSVVVEALESIDTPGREDAGHAVTNAVMRAIAMVAGKGTEANYIMRERDMYRDKVLEFTRLSPSPLTSMHEGVPVYRHRDATDEFVKP